MSVWKSVGMDSLGLRVVMKVMWCEATNFLKAVPFWSMETAMMTSLGISWWSWTSEGTSATQGGHQVAQKLTSTTWPLKSAKVLVVLPSLKVKFGATLPGCGGRTSRLQAAKRVSGARRSSKKNRGTRTFL